MKVGDLVKVHWGKSDHSGEEGVDWGYAAAIIAGEVRWWNDTVRGVVPCGDVDIWFRGQRTSFNIGRLEAVNASR